MFPIRRRVSSPTGKPRDSTFPSFINGSNTPGFIKTIDEDGAGYLLGVGGRAGGRDHGLGGARLVLEPGDNIVMPLAIRNNEAIDNTINTALSARLDVSTGYSLRVTPRYRLWRDG